MRRSGTSTAELTDHLAMCKTHLEDENSVLHTALEACRPGASAHATEDHDDHIKTFRELNGLLDRLASAPREQRKAILAALYRRFGRFIADDLLHMEHEEYVLLSELQSAFSDLELRELEGHRCRHFTGAHGAVHGRHPERAAAS